MKILFAADMSFGFWEEHDETVSAKESMQEAAEVFQTADFSVLNLENVFGDAENLTPIIKSGPNLISDASCADYIDALHPTVVGLANNHCGDFGAPALRDTMNLLQQKGYQCIGAGDTIEKAYEPAILQSGETRVAVFAVCENEFGVATKETAGSAGYRLSRVANAIATAKANGMLPMIYFHGGNERNPFPSPGKVELYRHFADLGAAAVIAMHTHCPQGYEVYHGCPIIYSMGNFFFPMQNGDANWYHGYMTMLHVEKDNIVPEIVPYRFDNCKQYLLRGEEKEHFMHYIDYITKPIGDETALQTYFDSWCMLNGLLNYIDQVQYTPSMIPGGAEATRRLKNIFSCEAHNELIHNTLEIIFAERTEEAKGMVDEIKLLQQMKVPGMDA